MARRRSKQSRRNLTVLAGGVLLTAVLLLFQPLLGALGYDIDDLIAMVWQPAVTTVPAEGTAEVHFIDVGQASSILIKGSEKTALIDGGESQNAPAILAYLEQQGVGQIDYFFNTHPHSDHMGGCLGILDGVPTGEFIMTALSEKSIPTTVTYQKLITWLGDHKETVTAATGRVGDRYDLGGGLWLELIGPVEQYDDLNNTSLVLRMDFGETSFLFPGDMETRAQRDMMEQGMVASVTVLAAPHHGSDTSIDPDFTQRLSPEFSIISCGEGNDYGHPSPATLKLYEKLGIQWYRTDQQGSVKVVTDGTALTITTEKE